VDNQQTCECLLLLDYDSLVNDSTEAAELHSIFTQVKVQLLSGIRTDSFAQV